MDDAIRDMPATAGDPARTFVQVSEVWVPEGDRLVFGGGSYGPLSGFEAASREVSFARGEGLPGRAWAEARPVVLKGFDGSYFRRTEAAAAAGLTAAVAIPVFAGAALKAVLVVLCTDAPDRSGAIEVWAEADGQLSLADGYYGAARDFEDVSRGTTFRRGQGLPGGVWASGAPMLMRDLGAGYGFLRSASAGAAGLSTGLGFPVPVPGGGTFVVTLLSATGSPIANRFEIWNVEAAHRGGEPHALLADGICAREGPLWPKENPAPNPRRAALWAGPVGRVLGSGLPVVETGGAGLPAGYSGLVALPVHARTRAGGGELSHVVSWYV